MSNGRVQMGLLCYIATLDWNFHHMVVAEEKMQPKLIEILIYKNFKNENSNVWAHRFYFFPFLENVGSIS